MPFRRYVRPISRVNFSGRMAESASKFTYPQTNILRHDPEALRQNHHLISWNIVLLYRLSDNLLRNTIAVDVCCVPSVETSIEGCFQQWKGLFFTELLDYFQVPNERNKWENRAANWLTSSSSIDQSRVRLSPKLIVPKMGTETRRPLFPRRTYSALLSSTDF